MKPELQIFVRQADARPRSSRNRKPRRISRNSSPHNKKIGATRSAAAERVALLEAQLRRAEAAIRDFESWADDYAGIFHDAPVGYVVLDETGRLCRYNAELLQQLNVNFLPQRTYFSSFVMRDDIPLWLQHLRKCRTSQLRQSVEVRLARRDGILPVQCITQPPLQTAASPDRFFRTIVVDISEKKAAEAALDQTRHDLKTLVDTVHGVVWQADARTMGITFISRSAESILGYPANAWSQPGFWEQHIYIEDRENVMNQLAKAVAQRSRLSMEYRVVRPDRRLVWVQDTITVHEYGKRLRISGVAVDITTRKTAEEELRKAQEHLEARVVQRTADLRAAMGELEAFSYSISHDMRAPLRAMQGYSKVLLDQFSRDVSPTAKDYLQRVILASERLDHLIQDVLSYSRVVREPIKLKPVELEPLLRSIIRDYPSLQEDHATIDIQPDLPPVAGHEALLTQCFSNLLCNAVKFVRPGDRPHVRIWAQPLDKELRVWVEDNGIGIPQQHHERIFGMFNRLHRADQYEGTGIGLAIVKRAVERMGGHVGVQSEPGKGSRFWLRLKTTQSAERQAEDRNDEPRE